MGRVQQGRWDRLARKITDQFGPGSKAGELLSDVFPVMELENTTMELKVLCKWDFGLGASNSTSAVGETNSQQLFNPAGSGKIVVVTEVILSVGGNNDVSGGISFAALATSASGSKRNTIAGAARSTVALIQNEDDGATIAGISFSAKSGEAFRLTDSDGIALLYPGSGLRFTNTSTASELHSSFFWRERAAVGSELEL